MSLRGNVIGIATATESPLGQNGVTRGAEAADPTVASDGTTRDTVGNVTIILGILSDPRIDIAEKF